MLKSFELGVIISFVTTPLSSTLGLSAIELWLSTCTGILQRPFLLQQSNASDAPAVLLSVHESLGAALANTLTRNSCSDVFSSSESYSTCCCSWPVCKD